MIHRRYRRIPLASPLIAVCALSSSGCDDNPGAIGPGGITAGREGTLIIEGPQSVAPGASATFQLRTSSVAGQGADLGAQVVWTTSNPDLLRLTGPGTFVALGRGETTISGTLFNQRATHRVFLLENGTYKLSGRVLDEGEPLPGARIEVAAGTGVGLHTTAINGWYALYGVAGDIEIEVRREDYKQERRLLRISGHHEVDLPVTLINERPDLRGDWRFSFRPSSSCQGLPDEAALRTYDATLVQQGPRVSLTLSSGRLQWSPVRLTGELRGRVFEFSLPLDPVDGPWLSERLASGGSLTLSGEASGEYVAGGFDLRLAGELRVYPPPGASGGIVTCTQLDHRVRLERRAVSQH
jgi:hypothetical protein